MSSTEQLKRDNAQFLFHPMASPAAMRKNRPDIIARGEGCWVWDVDGHKMLDGVAGLWSSNLGHSNKAVRDAIVAQLDELPFYNTFRGTTHPRAIELSTRIVETMAPDGVAAVMFGNGGSDAVEAALKMARQYWKLKGQPERTKFISLKNGYHGVHYGGMSVNGLGNIRRAYEPLLPGCFHVDSPWPYRNAYTQDEEELGRICAGLLEREILFQGADTVAAFIAEPIQGSGGVIVPPANFWPLVREVCDRHGVLLIADEVVTGFGRAGTLFGTRLWGVKADIWCLAKGISSGYVPLGGVLVGERIAKALIEAGTDFEHGFTYSGHPVACAVAIANLRLIQRLNLVSHVQHNVGPYLAERFAELADHPLVGETQTCGLMGAVQLVKDKASGAAFASELAVGMLCRGHCFANGLIMRAVGDRMIIAPPLVMTRAQVDEMMLLIKRCLDLTLGDLRQRGWFQ